MSLHMVSVCPHSVYNLMVSFSPLTFYPREISPVPTKHGTQWASRTGAGRFGEQNNQSNLPEIESQFVLRPTSSLVTTPKESRGLRSVTVVINKRLFTLFHLSKCETMLEANFYIQLTSRNLMIKHTTM